MSSRSVSSLLSVSLLAAATVWAPVCAPAWGQTGGPETVAGSGDPAAPPAAVVAEQVVVTATRLEQPLSEVPANVTVIERAQLDRSASLTIDDTLRQVPGFSLFRRSSSLVAHPTSQGVSLRGIGPSGVSRTLVLLDGVPLNDPFGGWVYWSKVPQEPLERVELVRGGGSSVWGNYALGGVIQLLTARPEERFVRFLGVAGEHQTWRVDASAGRRFGSSDLSLRASGFETDGFPVVRADQRGAIDVPAFSENRTIGGKARFALSTAAELSLQGDYFDEDRGNGTPLTGNATEASYLGLTASQTGLGGGRIEGALFFHGQDFSSTFSAQAGDRASERPALDQFLVDSEALGLSLKWVREIDAGRSRHSLGLGSDVRFIDGETNEDFRNLGSGFTRRRRAGGEQRLAGLFIQDNLTPGPRWQLNLGLRVDRWESRDGFRFERSLEDGSPTLESVFADRVESELSPKLALLFAASDWVSVEGSLYRAFRAPTVNELFRPFRVRNDITEANAELEPERLDGAELAFTYRAPRAHARLGGFWNEVSDPIANVTLAPGGGFRPPCGFVPGGGSCRQRQNLGESRIRGLEAELGYHPAGSPWSLAASYLRSEAEVIDAPGHPELEGKRIAQVPEDQLVLKIERGGRAWTAAVQGRYLGEQFEDDLNDRLLDEATLVDVHLGRSLGTRWQLFAGLENVFDEEVDVGVTGDGLVSIGTPRLVHLGVRLRP